MNRIKISLIASFTVLVLVVLGFTGTLNILSFKKQFTESLVNGYEVVAGESVRKIEYSVKYGKPINNFYGIEALLQQNMQFSEDITNIQIIATNGDLIYNKDGRVEGKSIDAEYRDQIKFTDRTVAIQTKHIQTGGEHQVYLPIFDGNGKWIATYNLSFADAAIQKSFDFYANKILLMLAICGAAALILLIIFNVTMNLVTSEGEVLKVRLLTLIIGILSITQLTFSIYNYQLFKDAYQALSNQTVTIASSTMKYNIDALIKKGVPYDQMFEIDKYFANTAKSIPLIDRIQLVPKGKTSDDAQSKISIELPKDKTGASFSLEVRIDDEVIAKQLRNTVFDGVTVLIISFLFLVEITMFLLMLLRGFVVRAAGVILRRLNRNELFNGEMIRPLTFAFAFAIFMPLSFIPIVMKGKVTAFLGLSEEVLLALPITVEILFAFVATMIAGALIDQYGWRKGFLFGAFAFACGSALSGLADSSYELYLAGRMIVGLGYGFGLLSLRAYVQQTYETERQSGGFSSMFSGLYAGVNGGVIVGALLADRLGYSFVFLLASGIILLSILIALIYTNPTSIEQMRKLDVGQKGVSIWKGFLLNPGVAGFFLFLLIPISVASMFLDYYFPLYAKNHGVSSGDVGRVFLLHGLIVVYLGPILLRLTERWFSNKVSVILSGVIVIAGLLIFAGINTVEAAILAVVFLGVSDSFGLVAQNNYLLRLPQTSQIGSTRALGYFDNFRKFGQMVSPMIFGGLAFMGGYGVGIIGMIFVVLILCFTVIVIRNKEKSLKESA